MDMKSMADLKSKICKELEPISRKKEFTPGDFQMVHMATDIIKNILKIETLEEGGYSRDGKWEAQMNGSYGDGNSYAGRGMHYVRGHYSRDNGMSRDYSRDSSYDYSRDSGRMAGMLEDMMHNASNEKEREALRRCISEMCGR